MEEEARRIYAIETDNYLLEAAEEAFSHEFHIGFGPRGTNRRTHPSVSWRACLPIYASDKSSCIAASVRKIDNGSRKLLPSYPEVVIYYLKKFATDQAIEESYVAILRYLQLGRMTPQQYADDWLRNHAGWLMYMMKKHRAMYSSKERIRQVATVSETVGLRSLSLTQRTLQFKQNRCCPSRKALASRRQPTRAPTTKESFTTGRLGIIATLLILRAWIQQLLLL